MLARLPCLHPTRYQRAFPRNRYWYLAGSGPGSSEHSSLTRNLLYLVMRIVTCTPVGLGPGIAHTLAKVGLGGLLLQGVELYAPGDWVENSHSSPIFTGSDACLLPAWNCHHFLHSSDFSFTFPFPLPHTLKVLPHSLCYILICTTTVIGWKHHHLLASSNIASTFHIASSTYFLFNSYSVCKLLSSDNFFVIMW